VNLFLNSIENSDNEKRIEVKIEELSDKGTMYWHVSITDFGNGIDPAIRSSLFTRFMEDANGRGLGLSVIKSLVTLFDGTVSVANRVEEDYTQGTVFHIFLPQYEEVSN
jgi:signal transduction histidine kinase